MTHSEKVNYLTLKSTARAKEEILVLFRLMRKLEICVNFAE